MINSKELLQKFSRRLGIPESEGKLSLEIFAKLISQKLGFGDEVEIDSLGYFAYKKVKPVHSESDEYQKIILFSEEKISGQNKNSLLFVLVIVVPMIAICPLPSAGRKTERKDRGGETKRKRSNF